jgi:fido (protein-threonine AMPylation protein)
MQPPDYPAWEYANHPKRALILRERTEDILVQLYQRHLDFTESAADTRPIHGYLFSLLVPREYIYYAGHYRGEDFPGLKNYEVVTTGNTDIGYPAFLVVQRMEKIGQWVREGIKGLDAIHERSDTSLSLEDKLLNTVAFACMIFDEFLQVHPYVNGNGHAARFMLWAILGRYGYWPQKFPIEPRPNHPLYAWAITEYRKGNKEALENYILRCIGG